MLEAMDAFFEARLSDYDGHMLRDIRGAAEFYPYTASLLPAAPARILDLGCGTGLELEAYFRRCPEAEVTGIDLSEAMLRALRLKFPGRRLELIRGSYRELPLGEERCDAAVSVESLHHFTPGQKAALYASLLAALKPGGRFILTDYFADSEEGSAAAFEELGKLRKEAGLGEDILVHYDTPLTVQRETALLREAGFSPVEELRRWGATATLAAVRPPKNTD